MATPPPQLRQLKDRQGVQKTSASPKNAACQACHARKKRCVPASAPAHHYRCINCCREGRNCLPRAVPPRLPQRQSNTTTNKASPSPSHNKFNIPLPHGIDHEVPRWSAMYSMFSEMLRLIPPERAEEDEDDVKHEACMGRENGMDADLSDNRSGSAREDDMKDAIAMPESTNPAVGKAVDLPDIGGIRAEFSLGELDALLRF